MAFYKSPQRWAGRLLLAVLCTFMPAATLVASTGSALPQTLGLRADFNGDGFADLAIAVANDRAGGFEGAGVVNVLYGSADGVTAAGNQMWSQNSPGIADEPGRDEGFGAPLEAGDFDGDGYSDLAIGVSNESVGEFAGPFGPGAVNVIYGSADGLTAEGSQFWHQDSPGILDQAESMDRFGSGGLAAGDFDGDGLDDLAIGVRLEDVGAAANAGAVSVLYGSDAGLTADGNQFLHQDSPGIKDQAEGSPDTGGDEFGSRLVAEDFDGDGIDDLAVSAAWEDVGAVQDAGAVNVIYGSLGGLSSDGNQFWHQDRRGVEDKALQGENFGGALTAGDFDADGRGDLAIGVPRNAVGGPNGIVGGAVDVLYGTGRGLRSSRSELFHQDSPGMLDQAEDDDWFGTSLTSADFDGDDFTDVAIGVQNEGLPPGNRAGAVSVVYGTSDGLTAEGNQFWHQDSPGVLDQTESEDLFGFAVGGDDFDGDGAFDLAVGVPFENLTFREQGGVNVLYGTEAGLDSAGNQFWSQDSPGVLGGGFTGDRFGGRFVGAG